MVAYVKNDRKIHFRIGDQRVEFDGRRMEEVIERGANFGEPFE